VNVNVLHDKRSNNKQKMVNCPRGAFVLWSVLYEAQQTSQRVERNETKGRFFHLSLEIVELHIYAEVLKLLKMRKE